MTRKSERLLLFGALPNMVFLSQLLYQVFEILIDLFNLRYVFKSLCQSTKENYDTDCNILKAQQY